MISCLPEFLKTHSKSRQNKYVFHAHALVRLAVNAYGTIQNSL
jgi:hypothetical protein